MENPIDQLSEVFEEFKLIEPFWETDPWDMDQAKAFLNMDWETISSVDLRGYEDVIYTIGPDAYCYLLPKFLALIAREGRNSDTSFFLSVFLEMPVNKKNKLLFRRDLDWNKLHLVFPLTDLQCDAVRNAANYIMEEDSKKVGYPDALFEPEFGTLLKSLEERETLRARNL